MKKYIVLFFSLSTLYTIHGYSHTNVYINADVGQPAYVVQEAPPAEIVEVATPSPGPDCVWIKGCWTWNNKWEWKSGYWDRRPHESAVWVGGYWSEHPHGGWVHHHGYWR